MKNLLKIIPVLFLVISCGSKVSLEDLDKMNGYWEVTKVELPDGTEKDYGISTTVDFIAYKDGAGFRQKVMPQLDGKYVTNGLKESIVAKDSTAGMFLKYTLENTTWTEQVVKVSDEVLVTKNDQDFIYHYKKFEPIIIE